MATETANLTYLAVMIALVGGALILLRFLVGRGVPWSQVLLLFFASAALVYVGSAFLNTTTNHRASPDETAPWLGVGAILAGAYWIRKSQQRLLGSGGSEPLKPPPPTVSAGRATPVFISYRRDDTADITGRIYDVLVQRFGRNGVFKDVDSIPLGVDFRKHLADSVGQCRVVLAVIGQKWLIRDSASPARTLHDPRDYVRIELLAALAQGKPIIPVLVQGAAMPDEEHLPEELRQLAYHNAVPVRADPDFHPDMARLIKGIEGHLSKGG